MKTTESTVHNGISKIDRYKWKLIDLPGEMRWLNKHSILVDHSYQRLVNEDKVKKIVREWSWIAAGTITVGERENKFYAIDGQHRVMAARRRTDIDDLPCLIFMTEHPREEALGFLRAQTCRKPITSVEKFRAQVVVGDPDALAVNDLLLIAGRTPGNGKQGAVKCISTLMRWAENDLGTLRRLWPLICALCDGDALPERIVEGLLHIERRMPSGTSLMDREWQKRVKKVGADGLLDAAARASAFYARGGSKIWAFGMVEAINRGHRIRLDLVE